eukprot:4347898-Alexandrium_andersonii.AAC.1
MVDQHPQARTCPRLTIGCRCGRRSYPHTELSRHFDYLCEPVWRPSTRTQPALGQASGPAHPS